MSDKLEYRSLTDLCKSDPEVDRPLGKIGAEAGSDPEVNQALEKIAQENRCDHGVVFDQAEAEKLVAAAGSYNTGDPAVDFIMGSPASSQIRKRYPRLDGLCPKGCGYRGIAYASFAHMLYGDW